MVWHQALDETLKWVKSHTANALTLINLGLGCLAIIFVLHMQPGAAVFLIALAALIDRLDGMVARKLDIVSDFGKQLDSLCDLVSFGLAPIFLLYTLALSEFGITGIFFSMLFVACGAIRLAKFNIVEFEGYFVGLPITAAGVVLTISAMFADIWSGVWFLILTFVLSFLMIGPFRLKKM
ncbi:CDP-diacylglycerol--serine O-phosphatidyltransferase [Salsuginibacillus halophilus]|uniref:CDP-diacylglycerol--serine O-phosphatidyltransferase n=1 Tax=Salsuginibacillus halophilus TaxID=517424 RepID=A0A2P8HFQ9_9BACI|nr:CDP-diacylglycerol--serine O-phosphatidyltransferase [Salsuginibacillus halophilus]